MDDQVSVMNGQQQVDHQGGKTVDDFKTTLHS